MKQLPGARSTVAHRHDMAHKRPLGHSLMVQVLGALMLMAFSW